jgi:hypothetical protein
MTQSLKSRLREFLGQASIATPGEWRCNTVPTSIGSCHKIEPIHACIYDDGRSVKDNTDQKANAAFIASSRTLGPLAAEKLLEAIEVIELYSQFEVRHKVEGGAYDPKLGAFVHKTISDWNGNPARAFLESLEQEGGG